MTRSLPDWIGENDDTPVPRRVKDRVWQRECGKCHRCERKIPSGDAWIIEHRIAIINLGANAEHNLCLTCSWCKPQKDAEDVAQKAKNYRVRAKHIGLHRPKVIMPGSRASRWKKKLNGQVVLRDK